MQPTQGNRFTLHVNMPSPRVSGMNRLLAEVKKKTLRSRVLTALFGAQNEVLIILPSRDVNNVTFTREANEPAPKIAAEFTVANDKGKEAASHDA